MKKFYIIFLLIMIFSVRAEGQAVTWQRLYNGPNKLSEIGSGVCQLNDGNYIVVGAAKIPIYSMYILKLNQFGDTLWTKTIGGYGFGQFANSVTPSDDGGFVFTGDADSAFAIKLSSSGNIIWEKKYGNHRYVQCYDITNSSDGGYIACGRVAGLGGYIYKIDSLGNLLWEKIIPGEFVFLQSVSEAHGFGYILTGTIYDTPNNDTLQTYLLRIDNSGNIIWNKRFLILDDAGGKSIGKINSGYLVSGTAGQNVGLPDEIVGQFFIRLDLEGNSVFSKIFNNGVRETSISQLIINENKYLFANDSDSLNFYNAKLLITDSLGNILKQKVYPSIKSLDLASAKITISGDFIFTGTWEKFGAGDRQDIYVLKTDSNLNAPPVVNIISNNSISPSDFILNPSFPNPFNPITNIKFELRKKANVILKIYSSEGKEIIELINESKPEGIYNISWNATDFNSGIYFCQLQIDKIYTKTIKLILLK